MSGVCDELGCRLPAAEVAFGCSGRVREIVGGDCCRVGTGSRIALRAGCDGSGVCAGSGCALVDQGCGGRVEADFGVFLNIVVFQ